MAYYDPGGYGFDDQSGSYDGYYYDSLIESPISNEAEAIVHQLLQENDVVMFAFTYCGPCKKTKALLDEKQVPYMLYNLDTDPYITKQQYFDALEPLSGIRSVPQLFIHGQFYGGSVETRQGLELGEVQEMCGASGGYDAHSVVHTLLQENQVVLFAFTYCGPCKRTKALLDAESIPYMLYNLDTDPNISKAEYMDVLEPLSGLRSVPQLFVNGEFYGDSQQIRDGVLGGEVGQMCGLI